MSYIVHTSVSKATVLDEECVFPAVGLGASVEILT